VMRQMGTWELLNQAKKKWSGGVTTPAMQSLSASIGDDKWRAVLKEDKPFHPLPSEGQSVLYEDAA